MMSSREASRTITSREFDIRASLHQIVEGSPPTSDGQFGQHVKRASVGRPRRAAEGAKRGCVDHDWKLASFLVRHAGDAKSRTEFAERLCETVFVVSGGRRHEVDVVGLSISTMKLRAEAADHDVFDVVPIQHPDDPCGIERRVLS
jgi:hypothetical protein